MWKILLMIVGTALVCLLMIKAIVSYARFEREKWRIKTHVQYAISEEKKQYWREKLCHHYLCLIPFVTKRNVEQVYTFLFCRSKKDMQKDDVYHVLAPSLLSLCICIICLCGTSWAWFTATTSSGVATIETANYTAEVVIAETRTDTKTRIVTIHVPETVTATTGYCEVILNGETYYTPKILKGEIFSFEVQVEDINKDLKITPMWGTPPAEGKIINPT